MGNKGKKGGDRIISVYWFAILFIVAAAVVYMAVSFYGEPYDVRGTEASLMTNLVADCLTPENYLRAEVFEPSFRKNLLENCGINFETEDIYDWGGVGQYYIEINISDFYSGGGFSMSDGNTGLKEFCDLDGKTLPVCLNRNFYSVDKEGKQYQVDILSIVRKTEKNVQ